MVKVLIKSLISGLSISGYQSGGSSTKSGSSDQSLGKSQSAADRRDGLPQADDNTTWIEKETMNASASNSHDEMFLRLRMEAAEVVM